MKNNKPATGLLLTLVAVLWGGGQAYAKNAGAKPLTPITTSDPIHNPHSQRQETPHSQRKAAAIRLKVVHEKARAEQMAQDVREHGHGHKHGHNLTGVLK